MVTSARSALGRYLLARTTASLREICRSRMARPFRTRPRLLPYPGFLEQLAKLVRLSAIIVPGFRHTTTLT